MLKKSTVSEVDTDKLIEKFDRIDEISTKMRELWDSERVKNENEKSRKRVKMTVELIKKGDIFSPEYLDGLTSDQSWNTMVKCILYADVTEKCMKALVQDVDAWDMKAFAIKEMQKLEEKDVFAVMREAETFIISELRHTIEEYNSIAEMFHSLDTVFGSYLGELAQEFE